MRALVLAVLAACYSPDPFTPCTYACASDGDCPPGLTCNTNAGVCRSADNACTTNPEGDDDADGVPNSLDNCRDRANSDQRDHDDDRAGDACDPCPHLSNTVTPGIDDDVDGDGLGGGCDPDPQTGGDQLVVFQGFYTDATGWNLQASSGSWTVVDGALRIPEATVAGASATYTGGALANPLVMVMFAGGATGLLGQRIGVEVFDGSGGIRRCEAKLSGDPVEWTFQLETKPEDVDYEVPTWMGPLADTRNMLRLHNGPTVGCSIEPNPPRTPIKTPSTATPLQTAMVKIFVDNLQVDVDYIFIANGK